MLSTFIAMTSESLNVCVFDTYVAAYDHSTAWVRCAHVACGIIINGKFSHVSINSPSTHAEVAALTQLAETRYKLEERGNYSLKRYWW